MTRHQIRAAQAEADLKVLERVAGALLAVAAAVAVLTSCQPAARAAAPAEVSEARPVSQG